MIVEVLSPSTEDYDRGEKWEHYQRLESLREYVLVSQDGRRVEVFARAAAGAEWQRSVGEAGAEVELPSLDVRIGVDMPYNAAGVRVS